MALTDYEIEDLLREDISDIKELEGDEIEMEWKMKKLLLNL